MTRPLLALFLALSLLALSPGLAPASAETASLGIAVDRPDFATSVVSGTITNVPAGTTSAMVTITLANGSTKSVTTSGAGGWKFKFTDVYLSGPWLQLAVLTSGGAGASLPNSWTANEAANWVAENTPKLPEYSYPPGFPGLWYGYYGPAYGFFYAYGNGLPPLYGPAPGFSYGRGYSYPLYYSGYSTPWYGGCSLYGYGWYPYR